MRRFACHLSKCTRGKICKGWTDLSSQSVHSGGKKPEALLHTHTHLLNSVQEVPSRFLAQAWVLASLIEANKLLVGQTLWPRRLLDPTEECWFQWGVSLVSPETWQYQKRSCVWGSWLSWTYSLFFSMEILKILEQHQENITCGLTSL